MWTEFTVHKGLCLLAGSGLIGKVANAVNVNGP